MARAHFTEAKLRKAIRAALVECPTAILEVTAAGSLRILPQSDSAQKSEQQARIDRWFNEDAN